jgi:hypothetical protein
MATWYAQNAASANFDAKTGNTSTVWFTATSGGTAMDWVTTPPAAGDIFDNNGKAVVLNYDLNIGSTGILRANGATYTMANATRTIVANVTAITAHVAITQYAGITFNLTGTVTANTTAVGINGTTGILNLTGSVVSGTTGKGIALTTGTVNVYSGTITGGTGVSTPGVLVTTGAITCTDCILQAGSGQQSYSIFANGTTGAQITLTRCTLLHSTATVAVVGKVLNNMGATNYEQWAMTGGTYTLTNGVEVASGRTLCLGDYALGATVYFSFSTSGINRLPVTLGGSPAVVVRRNDTAAPITFDTPPVVTVDLNGVTGLNLVTINLNDADATAGDYCVSLSAGTIDGLSAVGLVLAHFSVNNRSTYAPIADIHSDVAHLHNTDVPALASSIAALPTASAIANELEGSSRMLYEIAQRLGGKVVIDRINNTIEVYDVAGSTLLYTQSLTTVGSVDTLLRS